MSSKKRALREYKSRKHALGQSKQISNQSNINAWLMALATFGLLLVALAQLYLAREHAKSAESLARLELAKAQPRVTITPSQEVVHYGGSKPGTFVELPEHFNINLVSGIDSIFTIDAPITLHVSDDDGVTSCFIEVRGLYIQSEQRDRLDIFSPPHEEFAELVNALWEQGVEFNYPKWNFVIRYYDIYGDLQIDHQGLRLQQGHPPQEGLVLFNGIWSDGAGFYYDDDPSDWCPQISDILESTIRKLGGAPGNFGQPAESPERP